MQEQEFNVGVKALITNPKGEYLIVSSRRRPYWDLPGGRINKHESIEHALKRELKEELGIGARMGVLLGATISKIRIRTPSGKVGLCLLVYMCALPRNAHVKSGKRHHISRWVRGKEFAQLLSVKLDARFLRMLVRGAKSKGI